MTPYVMHVIHDIADGTWHLRQGESSLGRFATRAEAEQAGQVRGSELHEDGSQAQLVVHHESGSIDHEYICGHDPERFPE
jgi:hypothetical protein